MKRIVPEAAERLFLLNANPEEVYRYLRELAQTPTAFGYTLPDELQKDLVSRAEPIIHLAIAQFGDNEEAINELLAKDNKDLRIAVLANQNRLKPLRLLQDPMTGWLPEEVFDRLLSSGDGYELLALFGNPRLEMDILADVFARKGKYSDLPEERWMMMVIAALRNPQLRKDRQLGDFVDGYDMYRHGRPFGEIYKLLLRIEPSSRWATNLYPEIFELAAWNPDAEGALANIGEEMPELLYGESSGYSSKDWHEARRRGEELYLKQLLEHWKTPPPEEDNYRDLKYGEDHDRMRQAIVSRLPSHSDLVKKMLTHGDVWVRKGAYRAFDPSSPEELDHFYERDGLDFLEAAIRNPNFFRNYSDSAAAISLKLHDLVWYAERKPEDNTESDFTRDQYDGQLKRLHEADPSIFPLNSEAFDRPDPDDVADVDPGQAAFKNIERVRAEISDLSRNMQDSGGFKELSDIVNKLSDMVAGQSQISQEAFAALEERVLARIDESRGEVNSNFWVLILFLIFLVLVGAAIKFI